MRNYLKTKGKELKLTTLGFTLIELIAVITVLAIIALIAVPKVTEIIEDSEKKTIKNSASNLIRTVDMYLVRTNKKYGVVDILDKNLSYSGENFEYGQIEINKQGNSRMYAYKEGYCITKTYNGEIEIKESNKEECSGFVEKVLCKSKETVTNGNKAEGNFNYGDEYSCDLGDGEEKTFYILESNDDTVSLIMNMNIDENGKGTTSGGIVDWSSDADNSSGPVTALSYLESSTSGWTKLNPNQIILPSAEQIAKAVGQTFNNSSISNLPTWLHENLNINGIPYGYWTSTPSEIFSTDAWFVADGTDLYSLSITTYGMGVRPVITISKTQLG